eukprot:CAMPEP_0184404696 /NCGR_PEP_ID=MMETSP0007-20130409/86071_1 /TAXON_ID=97485 /ORGANISM="Prymnesium parvum, Strain Texoma1" /LENGTH=46 /DNA_ID= /DNA_START= /DNA_END= /DNA_ORIENTATION=
MKRSPANGHSLPARAFGLEKYGAMAAISAGRSRKPADMAHGLPCMS